MVVRTVELDDEELDSLPIALNTIGEINRALEAQDELAAAQATLDDQDMDIEMDMDMDMEEDDQRATIVRRLDQADRQAAEQTSIGYRKCPICSRLIPNDEMEEHMRYELCYTSRQRRQLTRLFL